MGHMCLKRLNLVRRASFWVLALFISVASHAGEDPFVAKLSFEKKKTHGPLEWKSTSVPVNLVKTPTGWVPQAIVQGTFNSEGASLICESAVIVHESEKGGIEPFDLTVQLTGEITPILCQGIDSQGKLGLEKAELHISAWKEIQAEVASRASEQARKKNILTPSIGVSSIAYEETQQTAFSELGLTLKLADQYAVTKQWDVLASGNWTALILSSSHPQSFKIQTLGLNAGAIYHSPWMHEPFSLSLGAGLYYMTSFTPGQNFGFVDMFGPQVFPSLKYQASPRDAYSFYLKFSPVTQSGSLTLNSHEIASGFAYRNTRPNRRPFDASVEFASDSLRFAGNSFIIHLSTLTLSLGYEY